ncbi:hypothetical protein E2562_037572 [Oryza meyeriana var. granulata]|uniref:Uncharacterized protein n=1 Tax=Oryza meyeriana var. granulata TaxID=110450 RepID=A0A6G1CLL7_9ORYZ|nr:hypothetical protein E2562_037572 [Oryza meyeriana var. granulata]
MSAIANLVYINWKKALLLQAEMMDLKANQNRWACSAFCAGGNSKCVQLGAIRKLTGGDEWTGQSHLVSEFSTIHWQCLFCMESAGRWILRWTWTHLIGMEVDGAIGNIKYSCNCEPQEQKLDLDPLEVMEARVGNEAGNSGAIRYNLASSLTRQSPGKVMVKAPSALSVYGETSSGKMLRGS